MVAVSSSPHLLLMQVITNFMQKYLGHHSHLMTVVPVLTVPASPGTYGYIHAVQFYDIDIYFSESPLNAQKMSK